MATPKTTLNHFDTIIIGAGPAGATTARVLAQAGQRVLLISARPPASFRPGESLQPVARTLLQTLGVWAQFEADGHWPCYGNLSAWGAPTLAEFDFLRSPYGHGWHLDRVAFDRMLTEAAVAAGATYWPQAPLQNLHRDHETWVCTFSTPTGPESAHSPWLVEATGRNAHLARRLGIRWQPLDRLLALYVRYTSPTLDEDARTLIEALPTGWFHTALIPPGERIVTFFTDASDPNVKATLTPAGFQSLVQRTTHLAALLHTHSYTPVTAPRATNARSGRLAQLYGPGWLATGDAATAFDPLSSQGLLSALYSGLKAGQALVAAQQGAPTALANYATALLKVYEQFVLNWRRYYQQEQRWPLMPFWQARH